MQFQLETQSQTKNKKLNDRRYMKFSKMLDKNKFSEYKDDFIDYKTFKKAVSNTFTEDQEKNFLETFKLAVENVVTLINKKHVKLLTKYESLNFAEDKRCEIFKDKLYILAEFIRVNLIGIKKIIRRHDRFTGFKAAHLFRDTIAEKNTQIQNINSLIQSISEKCRASQKTAEKDLKIKYWIPNESLVDVKLNILKYLPNKSYVKNEERLDDSFVTSIYLENTDFELYSSAIQKSKKPDFVRLRWFGRNSSIVSCEMVHKKNHGDQIRGFKISEKHILPFLNGKDVWEKIKSINTDNEEKTYSKIGRMIKDLHLRPMVRTFYKRCVFENDEGTVKVNLDSNIVMIKECSNFDFEKSQAPLTSWKRSDIASEWPFRNLPASEIVRFPYSVLEITGLDLCKDIENILSKSTIRNIQNFSKFIHGTAILYPTNDLMPFWLPQSAIAQESETALHRKMLGDDLIVQVQGESEISFNLSPESDDRTKVVIPVRVEPKAFFANERTFLSWVQFAIFLGGIGTAMVGLGDMHAYICGCMLIVVAGVFAIYSLYLFHYRASKIRVKDPGPYDAVIGPSVLVGIFILVMAMSFVFKFPIKKNGLQ